MNGAEHFRLNDFNQLFFHQFQCGKKGDHHAKPALFKGKQPCKDRTSAVLCRHKITDTLVFISN